jgi:inner membrane protein
LEPVTHLLTGACLGRVGLNRKTAYATLVTTLAAEFPDLDVLWSLRGPLVGFQHHRGFTHTLLGVPFSATVVVGSVYLFHRWQNGRGKATVLPPRWGWLFLFGIIAALSHLLLDFSNNYGVRPFAPFSWRWYSWDIVFIVEPMILAVLFLGLVVPALFGLVTQEIGGKRERFRGRGGAIFALVCLLLIWGVRDFYHRRATTALSAQTYSGEEPKRVAAMPYMVNPLRWAGIVETENTFQTMDIDVSSGEVDPEERAQIFAKPEETPVTLAAKDSRLGRVYLSWARFPLIETEPLPGTKGGYRVRFRDLRFGYAALGSGRETEAQVRRTLGASVLLDSNLHVTEERMGNRVQPID